MLRSTAIVLLVLFPSLAQASEVLLQNVLDPQGIYTFAIPVKRADRLPKWLPLNEKPPLEVGAAIKVAMRARVKASPKGTEWTLGEVRLSRTALGEPSLVWFYQVALRRAGENFSSASDDVIVLMDGSIVTPQFGKR